LEITFLGTGTSHGVPALDCIIDDFQRCPKGVCRLALTDIRFARTRSSILVTVEGRNILIDVSADFRQQALREQVKKIDAVLITHGHADHISGIPDIRSYTRGGFKLGMHGSSESCAIIRQAYGYVFDPGTFAGGGVPHLELHETDGEFELFGQRIVPVTVVHGVMKGCVGYRIGGIAYIPDMKSIAPEEEEKIKGVDTLILNCLREKPEHSTHMVLSQSMDLARRISPRRCYFIHMCHDIHYELDSAGLDSWMAFANDGLRITV
jgi:phosphoribosyl 1,2-cyclic phosphate phosphodiesterase